MRLRSSQKQKFYFRHVRPFVSVWSYNFPKLTRSTSIFSATTSSQISTSPHLFEWKRSFLVVSSLGGFLWGWPSLVVLVLLVGLVSRCRVSFIPSLGRSHISTEPWRFIRRSLVSLWVPCRWVAIFVLFYVLEYLSMSRLFYISCYLVFLAWVSFFFGGSNS